MKFLRENKRSEIKNWYSDLFKAIGRIQLQIIWSYKSNVWNKDNGKGFFLLALQPIVGLYFAAL